MQPCQLYLIISPSHSNHHRFSPWLLRQLLMRPPCSHSCSHENTLIVYALGKVLQSISHHLIHFSGHNQIKCTPPTTVFKNRYSQGYLSTSYSSQVLEIFPPHSHMATYLFLHIQSSAFYTSSEMFPLTPLLTHGLPPQPLFIPFLCLGSSKHRVDA